MADDVAAEDRFVGYVMQRLERAVRLVIRQQADHGQQIVIHVQPRGGGVRIQLPPIIEEVKRQ